MLKRHLITAVLSLAIWAALQAQQVWPGDVNNNGIVSGVDLLYWGLAYGSSGDARSMQGTDWQAYDAPAPWSQNFPGGVNFAYADCNGDGVVDESDYDDAIDDNFDLQHQPPSSEGFVNAGGGNAPKLKLESSVQAVEEGASFNITLSIDDALMPIDNFYGVALSLSYTTGLLEGDDGPDFELESDNWIESDNSYIQDHYFERGPQGSAALAITRTNQVAVPVEDGLIGTFSIVIEDIIVGLEVDTFVLQIDSVMLITPGFSIIPVTPDTAAVIVAKDLSLITAADDIPVSQPDAIRVYPRPARDVVFIKTEFPLTAPILIDQLGRALPVNLQSMGQFNYKLDCTGLSPGLYWLRVNGRQGYIFNKIIISH